MPLKRKNVNYDRARYTLPDVIDPPQRRCITIEIPDNIFHYAAFYGQILALSRAYSWGNDTAHTALEVAKVWKRVLDTLRNCENPPSCGGTSEGDEQLIRQNPTNPCLLENSINGTDWCVWADLSKCIPSGTQPGSGTPQPAPGGGQQCYHAQMTASNKWLLPTLVNAGDVIQVTNAKGAASDGTVSWFCPNGALFQLGACFGSGSTSGGDPLNTQPHMTLIAKINGVYYNVYNTTLTVPGGVSAAAVEFQVNDSSLSDNYGDLTWDVCITNNAAATWTHTFDFTTSDGGFASDAPNGGGVYTLGVGWQSNNAGTNTLGIHRTGLPSYTLTQAEYHVTPDNPTGGAQLYCYAGTGHNLTPQGYSGTTPLVKLLTGSFTETGGVIGIGMDGTYKSGGKTQTITKAVFSGTGASPF